MRWTGIGQILFALSFAAIGGFSLGYPGFARAWELLPKWLVGSDALIVVCGAALLISGVALLVPRTARAAALVLTAILVLRFLVLHVPRMIGHPLLEVVWESMSENLIYIGGAWTIFSLLARDCGAAAKFGNVRAGRIIFALALPAIGLSHFFYLDQTASLIPSWLPLHVALACFTGAAWIAAAAGILFGVLSRLAAILTAIMVSLFTLLIWVPMLIAVPTAVSDWSEMCASVAITGAAWAVAESYRDKPWRLKISG
jgi:uncharacterized membrane protein